LTESYSARNFDTTPGVVISRSQYDQSIEGTLISTLAAAFKSSTYVDASFNFATTLFAIEIKYNCSTK